MNTVKTSFANTERHKGAAFEAAAVLASPGPSGVITMGTFPLSLIAFGWIRRQKSGDPIATGRASCASAQRRPTSCQQVDRAPFKR
jgi:hypothetical protein